MGRSPDAYYRFAQQTVSVNKSLAGGYPSNCRMADFNIHYAQTAIKNAAANGVTDDKIATLQAELERNRSAFYLLDVYNFLRIAADPKNWGKYFGFEKQFEDSFKAAMENGVDPNLLSEVRKIFDARFEPLQFSTLYGVLAERLKQAERK